MVNGSLYAEGSAMDSSTKCLYCYCIRGQQHCVKPQCLLSETNCTPTYTTDSCCPSKYTCSGTKNDSTTTTSKPSASATNKETFQQAAKYMADTTQREGWSPAREGTARAATVSRDGCTVNRLSALYRLTATVFQ
ncbi:hypothetical protein J6590_033287 [Homalodisca vitripennis]|nr:hypothetical protein J6590_033287 [Homalodisca vitripennis]